MGVLPRFLYSAIAIVAAFFATAQAPLGDGLSDKNAYKKHGMLKIVQWPKVCPYRWRSLDRWASRISDWWPDRPATTVQALLIGWTAEAGAELHARLARAIASHARWGAAM